MLFAKVAITRFLPRRSFVLEILPNHLSPYSRLFIYVYIYLHNHIQSNTVILTQKGLADSWLRTRSAALWGKMRKKLIFFFLGVIFNIFKYFVIGFDGSSWVFLVLFHVSSSFSFLFLSHPKGWAERHIQLRYRLPF